MKILSLLVSLDEALAPLGPIGGLLVFSGRASPSSPLAWAGGSADGSEHCAATPTIDEAAEFLRNRHTRRVFWNLESWKRVIASLQACSVR